MTKNTQFRMTMQVIIFLWTAKLKCHKIHIFAQTAKLKCREMQFLPKKTAKFSYNKVF